MNPHYRDVRFRAAKPPGGWPERFGIVTAWNPMDRETGPDENARAHTKLVAKAAVGKLASFPVTGGSPDMTHQEPGLGIAFDSEGDAVAWGVEFEQRAVFWVEKGGLWLVSCVDDSKESLGPWDRRVIGEESLGNADQTTEEHRGAPMKGGAS